MVTGPQQASTARATASGADRRRRLGGSDRPDGPGEGDRLAGIDDFAFTGNGDEVIAALHASNTVVRIRPGRAMTTRLTGADGLQNLTSVALRGKPSTCSVPPTPPPPTRTCC
jgi:hypothetical protein